MDTKKEILNRFTFIYWLLIGVGIISFVVIISYMTIERPYFKEKSTTVEPREELAFRGDILDVNGRVICTDASTYEIRMDPLTEYIQKNFTEAEFYQKVDSLAMDLSKLFGDRTKEEYAKLIKDARINKNRNVKIKQNVNYFEFKKLKTFPLFKLNQYQGGLIYVKTKKRKNFNNGLARRTIGIPSDKYGYLGIERMMNGELSGTDGKNISQRLSGNYWRKIKTIKEPENGLNVVSTLDINMQDIISDILEKRLIELEAQFGVAILMEVKTGEIRAMVNLSRLGDSTYGEISNLAVGSNYSPGSVMKLVSFMIAFEKDPNLTLDKTFDTGNGKWQIDDDFAIKDYNYKNNGTGGFGRLTVRRIFELSSNVGTSKMIYSLYKDNDEEFLQRLSQLGFDKPMQFNLDIEGAPYFSTKENGRYTGISVRQLSIGYEYSISPMRVLTVFNAFANNGKMVKPMFVKETQKNGITVETFEPEILNPLICSEETLEKCKTLLEGVVENGTGKNYVKSDIVNIAGKSGTSQIYLPALGVYSNTLYNTTFVGYFPAEKPKYTCLVWINKPKSHKGGSSAAGPVLKQIAEQIYTFDYDLHHDEFVVNNMPNTNSLPKASVSFGGFLKNAFTSINIPYSQSKSSWVKPQVTEKQVVLQPMHIEKGLMPDVRGMNARDAVFILENYKLNIKINGFGSVTKQSITPGTKIEKNQIVTLELK